MLFSALLLSRKSTRANICSLPQHQQQQQQQQTSMATKEQIQEFLTLGKELEAQELEAPGGVATAQVYGPLLCVYLLQNDMCNAKFLWKRIPVALKMSTPELGQIWAVGQKMWQRDFPGIYKMLKKEWSDAYKPIMAAVLESTRKRAFNLVSQAFSSISGDDLASYVGLPVNEAVQAAQNEGWTADPHTRLVTPKKPESVPDPPVPNEQHLSVLTDYVSFLES